MAKKNPEKFEVLKLNIPSQWSNCMSTGSGLGTGMSGCQGWLIRNGLTTNLICYFLK